MGSSSSKVESPAVGAAGSGESQVKSSKTTVVCENCDKKTQKELPDDQKDDCMGFYVTVDKCMRSNRGQVSACVDEWREFQSCRSQQTSP